MGTSTDASYLVRQRAALQRVVSLVAQRRAADEVFAAVAREVGSLLEVEGARVVRFEVDGTATVVASWGLRSRVDSASGSIVARGVVWGELVAVARRLPAGAGDRIGEFARLVSPAISILDTQERLAASRARVVKASDATRRHFERDLHGVQQRLASLQLKLRSVRQQLPPELIEVSLLLREVQNDLAETVDSTQELAHDIHPAVLSSDGIGPALRALARRAAVPIDVEVDDVGRLDEQVELAVYSTVLEALANTAKHAAASAITVRVRGVDAGIELVVADDGLGGADPSRGLGLVGLADRVEAIGGALQVESPPGGGTTVRARLPASARTRVMHLNNAAIG